MDNRYTAGYFDGEGTIGIYWNKGSRDTRYKSGRKTGCWVRTVGITNTYRPLLEELKAEFGGSLRKNKKYSKRHKTTYFWALGSVSGIKRFLLKIEPFLHEKREQANVMLAFIDDRLEGDFVEKRLKELKVGDKQQ